MNKTFVKNGFIAAGAMNIGGVLLFSKVFTNETMNEAYPTIASDFGLLMIMVWGLGYLSVANSYENVRWLVAVFTLEKLIYAATWVFWITQNDLGEVYSTDMLAGIFYTIYGLNDFIFMLFFGWVFFKIKAG